MDKVFAQVRPVEMDLSTPYHTIVTHLGFLQEDNFEPEKAAQAFLHTGVSIEEAIDVAIQLKQVYDGKGIYINVEDLPTDPDYRDSLTRKHQYFLLKDYPEIYLERKNGKWLYSRMTFDRVDEIHKHVYPFGTDKLLNLLPKIGHRVIFGLHLWQYMAILILVLISVVVHKLLTWIFEHLIDNVLYKAGYGHLAKKYISPVARPFSYFVVFALVMVFVPLVQLPASSSRHVFVVLRASLPLFATLVFYYLVDIFCLYLTKLAERTESTLDDQLVPLVRKVLKIFVVVVGGMFVLQNLNFNITALLAGISIGGLAFALAAQDTLKNFFGSLMIFIDKPFQIGDWITSGDLDGTVEEVGFRSTRVRTFRNSVAYIPNGKLADAMVDNHGLRVYRRFSTKIAITYDTPPALIEVFIEGLNKIVEAHPLTRKDFYEIKLNDLADSSLHIMFYIFFKVPTWSEELQCRHEILLEVIKLADALGVRFAFPTQTLHMESFPEKKSLTPEYHESHLELKTKLGDYLKQRG
jgi:MscS family membrane protein